MKKTLAVLLVLLSFTLIMLCGCQETNTNENNCFYSERSCDILYCSKKPFRLFQTFAFVPVLPSPPFPRSVLFNFFTSSFALDEALNSTGNVIN